MEDAAAPEVQAASPKDAPETVVCDWTLGERLPEGPVCRSWRATRGDERGVVRVLREELARDADARAEWIRTSWTANRFEHAHVAKILQGGADASGAPVVVRPWVHGESLAAAVAAGRVDAVLAMRVVEQILDALEMAHAHGIVHGAIAPSNVIVTARRTIRLVDFAGAPGLRERRKGGALAVASARLSPFSAPERHADPAAPPSEASDIWSVGACLYFALSAQPPPRRGASLRDAVPGVDPNLAAVVDLALSHDPAERYESAYAMLGDVRRAMAGGRPKLDAALAPVPSQGLPDVVPLAPLSFGPASAGPPSAATLRIVAETDAAPATRREWRGNFLLMAAIAVIVGVASFVLFREKLADVPPVDVHTAHSP